MIELFSETDETHAAMHQHTFGQLIAVLEGQLELKLGGDPITLTEIMGVGDYVFVAAYRPHSGRVLEKNTKVLFLRHSGRVTAQDEYNVLECAKIGFKLLYIQNSETPKCPWVMWDRRGREFNRYTSSRAAYLDLLLDQKKSPLMRGRSGTRYGL